MKVFFFFFLLGGVGGRSTLQTKTSNQKKTNIRNPNQKQLRINQYPHSEVLYNCKNTPTSAFQLILPANILPVNSLVSNVDKHRPEFTSLSLDETSKLVIQDLLLRTNLMIDYKSSRVFLMKCPKLAGLSAFCRKSKLQIVLPIQVWCHTCVIGL